MQKYYRLKHIAFSFLLALLFGCSSTAEQESKDSDTIGPITIVVHGGAGTISKEIMTPEREKLYEAALTHALDTGYAILEGGGSSVDAVRGAITILENSPLFNAGKGAVFTNEEKHELDASIMNGSNLMAGAVAGVTTVKNPIQAAYMVMTKSEHVMLAGRGAEQFAQQQGLQIVSPDYFFDSSRYEQLIYQKEKEASQTTSRVDPADRKLKFGTVGCVALDQEGNLAAGTSTGGMSNKRFGRIGDAPVIGAGTYADNQSCAVSCTGWGEYFIRLAIAHDIHALKLYGGLSLQAAADSVVMHKLPNLGGDGGIIAVDRQGNISMTFNTEGMYRGFKKKGENAKVFIYKE